MRYEVENKYVVTDVARIVQQLESLGATIGSPVRQVDLYLAHPVRDFAATDEAFRIRTVGQNNFITYKGPKIDTATKTRRELEIPLASGAKRQAAYRELFEALGFRAVAHVRKNRRYGHLQWKKWSVELALDAVDNLGDFVELEILADDASLADAQARLLELADALGLARPLRTSYLEMLLEQQA